MNIKKNLKTGLLQLKQDIMDYYKVTLIIIVYIIITNLLFGSVCALVITTGVPCPACGLTRAGVSLLTLQFVDAWDYNCVIYLIVPFILYVIVCRYILQCKCRGMVLGLCAITICLFVLYIYRMLRFFPDISPMVYNKRSLLYQFIQWLSNYSI